MGNGHEPLQALGPVGWDDLPQDDLKSYLDDVFSQALIVSESVPSPSSLGDSSKLPAAGRSRAKTESAAAFADVHRSLSPRQSSATLAAVEEMRKDWKEIKTNPKDNPLGISVYKMPGKDGKGAWFARQSVHDNLSFDEWKTGLQKEFAESLKVTGSPGAGSIRGIGADKCVETKEVENSGKLNVYQLSAQFPGPTSPRDFITLLLTSDFSGQGSKLAQPLRQLVIVSKPCTHSECPPRQGIIRGQYESVEIIREIYTESPVGKKSMSSADLTAIDGETLHISKGPGPELKGSSSEITQEKRPTSIEWLMVTRSDPGGSVPRFMIEKGTPPGIIGDAGKFLKWVTHKTATGYDKPSTSKKPEDAQRTSDVPAVDGSGEVQHHQASEEVHDGGYDDNEAVTNSNGLYGIFSSIFGAASSIVATGLQSSIGSLSSQESTSSLPIIHDDEDQHSDTSSVNSFLSALEKHLTGEPVPDKNIEATPSEESKSVASGAIDKDLKKLQERRRKLDERFTQMQAQLDGKRQGDKEKDEASIAKMREKFDKEMAKRETKYKRELQKLEEKREQETLKAERKRRKTIEREEKSNLSIELEKVRTERDIAVQHNQILEAQVRELQSENTALVSKLGKLGGVSGQESTVSFQDEKADRSNDATGEA